MKLVLVKKKRRFEAPFLLHSISGSYRELRTKQQDLPQPHWQHPSRSSEGTQAEIVLRGKQAPIGYFFR